MSSKQFLRISFFFVIGSVLQIDAAEQKREKVVTWEDEVKALSEKHKVATETNTGIVQVENETAEVKIDDDRSVADVSVHCPTVVDIVQLYQATVADVLRPYQEECAAIYKKTDLSFNERVDKACTGLVFGLTSFVVLGLAGYGSDYVCTKIEQHSLSRRAAEAYACLNLGLMSRSTTDQRVLDKGALLVVSSMLVACGTFKIFDASCGYDFSNRQNELGKLHKKLQKNWGFDQRQAMVRLYDPISKKQGKQLLSKELKELLLRK